MPCGHAGLCNVCAIKTWKCIDECHLCREPIQTVYQIKQAANKSPYYQVVASTSRVKVKLGDKNKKKLPPPETFVQVNNQNDEENEDSSQSDEDIEEEDYE